MIENHPITPPPELVREWNQNAIGTHFPPYGYSEYIATQAARWGSDQELEACCEWLSNRSSLTEKLRDVRRPKPLSLKEQALEALQSMQIDPVTINGVNVNADVIAKYDTIRRALEALSD